MEQNYAMEIKDLKKSFKGFELNIPELKIPQGFATALIGENGAGKTTLLNILMGIRLDYTGNIKYFDQYTDKDRESNPQVKEKKGYTGTSKYYFPQWTIKDIEKISGLLFDNFSKDKFEKLCDELKIGSNKKAVFDKKNSEMSDGNKVKLMLAGVLARDTDMLVMDEPAWPLDPLMRDKLCQMIGDYIDKGDGKRSVLFSTHNISDMENITDYAIIMENGSVVEAGFVEDLKEKYILIKGDEKDTAMAKKVLFSIRTNPYGFEGICLASDLDKLAGMDVSKEIPTLFQISVAVMEKHTNIEI